MSIPTITLSLLALVLLHCGSTKAEICAGCPVEFDPKEEGTDRLLQTAFSTLNANSPDSLHLQRVIKATKQMVNGILYTLDVEMVNERTNGVMNCHVVLFTKPWVSSEIQIVSQNCQKTPKLKTAGLVGGLQPIDKDEKSLQKVTKVAIDRINQMTNSAYVSGLVEISRAMVQVVAGLKYYLTLEVGDTDCMKADYKEGNICNIIPSNSAYKTICDVVVLEKPWMYKLEIISSECKSVPVGVLLLAVMESKVVSPGGESDLDPNRQDVKEMSKFALRELDRRTNSENMLGLGKILGAKTKVVAGTLTTITMTVGETSCKKDSSMINSDCTPSKPSQVCTIAIWDRPWLGESKVVDASCEPITSNQEVKPYAGGVTDIDVNDEIVHSLINFSERELTVRMNSAFTQKIVKVLAASTQVVEGTLIRMTVKVTDSDCPKGIRSTSANCNATNEGQKTCDLEIWERPWLNSVILVNVECH